MSAGAAPPGPESKEFEVFWAEEVRPRVAELESASHRAVRFSALAMPAVLVSGIAAFYGSHQAGLGPGVSISALLGAAGGVLLLFDRLLPVGGKVDRCALLAVLCERFGLSYRGEVQNLKRAIEAEGFRREGLMHALGSVDYEDAIEDETGDLRMVEAVVESALPPELRLDPRRQHFLLIETGAPAHDDFTLRVLRDEGPLARFFQGLKSGEARVRLEDPLFEQVFEVFGSDQLEARRFLEPQVMTLLLERHADLGLRAFGFGLVGGRLRIALALAPEDFSVGSDLQGYREGDARRFGFLLHHALELTHGLRAQAALVTVPMRRD